MPVPLKGKVKEIAEDIYGVIWSEDDSVYGGYGANQGFAILEDSVLVFDTGMTKSQADFLCKSISQITSKKVRFIINSHDHSDHVFGNSLVARNSKAQKVTIISQTNCKDKMEMFAAKRLADYRSKDSKLRSLLDKVSIVQPNLTFSSNNLWITLEGTEMFFLHPETGAHTLGDTLLAFPQKGVIFAGDVIWNRFLPNLEDANLEGWIDTINDLDTGTYSKILPGHGNLCGNKEIETFNRYLKEVLNRLKSLDRVHADYPTMRKCFALDGTESWQFQKIVGWNVERVIGRKPGDINEIKKQ